jgi:UDP-N-acetylmuramate--alanine ligase
MHIYFSGIGGAGISSLALLAHQAGFEVSGSDKQNSRTIGYLEDHGIKNITIGQTKGQIKSIHEKKPIDWFVYSSAVALENRTSEEMKFCDQNSIKMSKRDEFLNYLITTKNLKLIAVAGTHGKSTTAAMLIWLFKALEIPVSYSSGAKISFGEIGDYDPKSEYFIYEADEFDHNFLSFKPYLSVISGVSWDHHEIYKTREDYKQAFIQFINQSQNSLVWKADDDYLNLSAKDGLRIVDPLEADKIQLFGKYNRQDGLIAVKAVELITALNEQQIITKIDAFPGLERRMEAIVPNLYSDYAHTPEKIKAAMSVASEMAKLKNQSIYVIYEPLTNQRQHYIKGQYGDCFDGAKHIFWIPSYLAREDPKLAILSPSELINSLDDPRIAEPAAMDQDLMNKIKELLAQGEMVVAMNGGGGNGLDEWLRSNFLRS